MKQVIVFPRGQLSAADKTKLTKHGFVAVEADDPKAVVVALPGASFVSPDDLLMAALVGTIQGNYASEHCGNFAVELHRRLKAREAKL